MSYMISWIVAGSTLAATLASPAMAEDTVGPLRLFETVIQELGTDDRRGSHRTYRLCVDHDDRGRRHGHYGTFPGCADRDDDDDDDRGRTSGRGRDRDDDD